MQKAKRILFQYCMLICIFFFVLFGGQAIYAAQASTNTNQAQTTQVSTPVSTIDWDTVKDCIKLIIGGSLLGAIPTIIGIYKFFLEKKYDIEDIEIEIINERLQQHIKYTDFICWKIFKNDRIIGQIDTPNPYYLNIFIKITAPKGRKTLNDIVIRKLILNMNGYKLICKPKNKAIFDSPKCQFNKYKEKEICELLLKWPTIKGKEDRVALNPTMTFRNPVCLSMYLAWYPSIFFASIGGFVFPQKREIVFEKIKHENSCPRIRIKSKGIFKGKWKNGYNNL